MTVIGEVGLSVLLFEAFHAHWLRAGSGKNKLNLELCERAQLTLN